MKTNRYFRQIRKWPNSGVFRAFFAVLLASAFVQGIAQGQTPGASPNTLQAPPSNSPAANANTPAFPAPVVQLPTGDQLLRRAIWQSVWGPPLSARVRQGVSQFDRQLVGVGQYWQAGQGSGQLKFLLRIAAGGTINSLLQVSDGRLLWTSHETASASLSRVDLGRVREHLHPGPWKDANSEELAMYLAIGGQPKMLRDLYHQYQWFNVTESMLDGMPVFVLQGRRRTEVASIAAAAAVDHLLTQEEKGLVPAKARLTLGRKPELPLFPYKIEYISDVDADDLQANRRALNSTIEFFDVVTPIEITPELFNYQVNDSVDQIVDDTPRYLPPAPLEFSQAPNGQVNR